MSIRCPSCSALHWLAERDLQSSARNPRFNSCCKGGEVFLDPLKEPPALLKHLLTSTDSEQAKRFRNQTRRYNAALAFTSLGFKPDRRLEGQAGLTSFQIQGELHHLQGPLLPEDRTDAQYLQLFFYDPREATDIRARRNPTLEPDLLLGLAEMLQAVNPWFKMYKAAYEILRGPTVLNPATRLLINPQLRLIMEQGADRRRENLPVQDEVAMIIPDEYAEASRRDIVLTNRTAPREQQKLTRIDSSHAGYMPLHYVLLFPRGESGWHYNLKLQNRTGTRVQTRLHQREYYRYRLHTRLGELNTLFRGCKLF